jgi:hypothetical protein
LAGRQHRERFLKQLHNRAPETAFRILSDLIGPLQHTSLGGSRYVLVFTDDFSRYSWTYFMNAKSETFSYFKDFKAKIENERQHKV